MFKHILVPTDGSKLAMKGAKAGVKLASALGARVTALYVRHCQRALHQRLRHGSAAMLLGSETQRVLAHSKLPVLVTR
jgi:nucleotide-binding universal stress UspA family protein